MNNDPRLETLIAITRPCASITAHPGSRLGIVPHQHRAAIAHGYGDKDWASLGNYIGERAGL